MEPNPRRCGTDTGGPSCSFQLIVKVSPAVPRRYQRAPCRSRAPHTSRHWWQARGVRARRLAQKPDSGAAWGLVRRYESRSDRRSAQVAREQGPLSRPRSVRSGRAGPDWLTGPGCARKSVRRNPLDFWWQIEVMPAFRKPRPLWHLLVMLGCAIVAPLLLFGAYAGYRTGETQLRDVRENLMNEARTLHWCRLRK
jgi:hypothetical protein